VLYYNVQVMSNHNGFHCVNAASVFGEGINERNNELIERLSGVAEKLGVEVDFNNPSSIAEFLVPGEKAHNPSYISLFDILQYLDSEARKQITQGMLLDMPYLIEKAAQGLNNKQKFIAELEAEYRDYDNPDGLAYFSIYPDSHFADTIPTEFMGAKLSAPRFYDGLGAYVLDCIQPNEDEAENQKYWKAHNAVKDLFLANDVSWDLEDCLAYIGSGALG